MTDVIVDEAGNTLVLFLADSTVHAVWYDAAGVAGAPFVVVPPALLPASRVPGQDLRFDRRLGGGFFIALTAGFDALRGSGSRPMGCAARVSVHRGCAASRLAYD